MEAIDLADAKVHLGKLVDRVEAGDPIDITRRGKPVARLAAVARPRKRIDADALQSLTATMTPPAESDTSLNLAPLSNEAMTAVDTEANARQFVLYKVDYAGSTSCLGT